MWSIVKNTQASIDCNKHRKFFFLSSWIELHKPVNNILTFFLRCIWVLSLVFYHQCMLTKREKTFLKRTLRCTSMYPVRVSSECTLLIQPSSYNPSRYKQKWLPVCAHHLFFHNGTTLLISNTHPVIERSTYRYYKYSTRSLSIWEWVCLVLLSRGPLQSRSKLPSPNPAHELKLASE